MMHYVIGCITLLLAVSITSVCDAEDYRAIALAAKNNAPAQTAPYQSLANDAYHASSRLTLPYQMDAKQAEQKAQTLWHPSTEGQGYTPAKTAQKKQPAILIFVSFSMPEQSLMAYLRDAKRAQACVVIRGLIDNSFPKTFQRLAGLIKTSEGDGVELNPLWFKKFDIKAVPAVVVVQDNQADVMTGNITLSSALKMIRDRGDNKDTAQAALLKLEDYPHA